MLWLEDQDLLNLRLRLFNLTLSEELVYEKKLHAPIRGLTLSAAPDQSAMVYEKKLHAPIRGLKILFLAHSRLKPASEAYRDIRAERACAGILLKKHASKVRRTLNLHYGALRLQLNVERRVLWHLSQAGIRGVLI